jgi:hypothetical protein
MRSHGRMQRREFLSRYLKAWEALECGKDSELDRYAKFSGELPIRIHVQQNGAGGPYQAVGPARNHDGSRDAGEWIRPQPAKTSGEQQPGNDENGHHRVRRHVDDRCMHVVIAMGTRRALMLFVEGGPLRRPVGDAPQAVKARGSGIVSPDSR